MKIAFRVDASFSIGSGHVIRCLNLADALRKAGNECIFFTKEHSGNLIKTISDRAYTIYAIPSPASAKEKYIKNEKEWLGGSQYDDASAVLDFCLLNEIYIDIFVVDHYSIDREWEKFILDHLPGVKLVVIDDLCNRKHLCDLLIDTTIERQPEEYSLFIPNDCITLLGTDYALLKPEFSCLRNDSVIRRKENKKSKKILITMGGVDINNVSGKVLRIIDNIFKEDVELITVVLGLNCPHKNEIKNIANSSRYKIDVKINIDNMPQLMLNHDASIGALGSTTWERAVLGLPTINIAIANNQLMLVKKLKQNGFIVFENTEFSDMDFFSAWKKLNLNYLDIVSRSFALCDGEGLQRVVKSIMKLQPH